MTSRLLRSQPVGLKNNGFVVWSPTTGEKERGRGLSVSFFKGNTSHNGQSCVMLAATGLI